MAKRLLNYEEELTNERLKDLCKRSGAHVFVKVRLADIFPLEGSGIHEEAYRFALQSHFDFVITNQDLIPLFGVEYDGPYHTAPTQQERDALKMDLCRRFKFPLLRVNARYLLDRRAGLDLLGWFIHAWFTQRAINNAYETGQLPPDAMVDPIDVLSIPGIPTAFPLWLSAEARADFVRRAEKTRTQDPIPSCMVGKDAEGNYHAVAWLRIDRQRGLRVYTGMRRQLFPVSVSEVVEDLAVLELHGVLKRYEAGEAPSISLEVLSEDLKQFRQRYHSVLTSWYGREEAI